MRINLPISQKVFPLPDNTVVSSTTDLKGRILEVNEDFLLASGYTRDELIGKAHNIVRHPDVPEIVFADLWETLKAGRSWRGIVKNRRKNGDTYWVDANVSPKMIGNEVIGYVSVRRAVNDPAVITAVEQAYRDIASGKLHIENGHIYTRSRWRRLQWDPIRHFRLGLTAQGLYALLPLLLVAVVLAGMQLTHLVQDWRVQARAIEKAQEWISVSRPVPLLQRERGLSAGWLASDGMQHGERLQEERAALDRLCESSACPFQDRILALRADIDSRAVATPDAIARYSQEIDQLLRTLGDSVASFEDLSKRPRAQSVLDLLWMMEYSGRERAQVSGALASGEAKPGLEATLNALASLRQARLDLYQINASGEKAAAFSQRLHEGYDALATFREAAINGPAQPESSDGLEGTEGMESVETMEGAEDTSISVATETVSSLDGFNGYTAWMTLFEEEAESQIKDWVQHGEDKIRHDLYSLMAWGITLPVALLISLAVLIRMSRHLRRYVGRLSQVLENVAGRGDFHTRVDLPDLGDELSTVSKLTDSMLNQIERALMAVNDVVAQVAQGNMNLRVTDLLEGDLEQIKAHTNAAVDSLDATMQELESVMKGLAQGELSVRLSERVKGELRNHVNSTLENLEQTIEEVSGVMSGMARGDFNGRVSESGMGAFAVMQRDINQVGITLDDAVVALGNSLSALANGRLNETMDGEFHGSLATVQNDMNSAIERLRDLITQVRDVVQTIIQGSQDMANESEELNSRTQQAAASLEETAASMKEIAEVVHTTDSHAKTAAQDASRADAMVLEGNESIRSVKAAMDEIAASSQQIGDVVQLIQGIAFQTNLLALNAAVEAARAGDAGRGFAVVASEVRNLSKRVESGADNIKTLIDNTQAQVADGSNRVETSVAVLKKLASAISTMRVAVADISHSISEQSSGVEQVNLAVSELDTITSRNASLVETSSGTAYGMATQASELGSLIETFVIDDKPGHRR